MRETPSVGRFSFKQRLLWRISNCPNSAVYTAICSVLTLGMATAVAIDQAWWVGALLAVLVPLNWVLYAYLPPRSLYGQFARLRWMWPRLSEEWLDLEWIESQEELGHQSQAAKKINPDNAARR